MKLETFNQQSEAELFRKELEIRGKYYFKGFKGLMQGLLSYVEIFANYGNIPEMPKIEASIRGILKNIVDLYGSIPFEQIANHPDYDLLLDSHREILQLVPKIECILSGKEKDLKGIYEIIKKISVNGQKYTERLECVKQKLNSQPGCENVGLGKIDIHGVFWNSVI